MYKLEITPHFAPIKSEFGNVRINSDGYCMISSGKEKNHSKLLHRLIWERAYGEIPPKTHIHHIDGNPLNNCIWNLEPISDSEHSKLHTVGHKKDIKSCLKTSEKLNKSGLFRVFKEKAPKMNQGFIWRYCYYVDGKQKKIARANLEDLKAEVERRNLEWIDYGDS